MNLASERQRLDELSRQRLICWRELESSIVAYAEAVVPRGGFAPLGSSRTWHPIADGKLAGPNHIPRIRLNQLSCFEKLLPFQMITEGGKKRPFCSQKMFDEFSTSMLAIGVMIRDSGASCPVVSIPAATQAIALFRLTGQPYPKHEHAWRARKVKAVWTRHKNRWEKLARAEWEEYRRQKAAP